MEFTKRIISPGTYYIPDETGKIKPVGVSRKRIKAWVEKHAKMIEAGLKVPAPFRHDPKAVPIRLKGDKQDEDSYQNGGFWKKLYTGDDGALYGVIESASREAANKIGKTVVDCSALASNRWVDGTKGETYEDAITHIALVTHPIAHKEGNFEPVGEELAASQHFSQRNLAYTGAYEDTIHDSFAGDFPPRKKEGGNDNGNGGGDENRNVGKTVVREGGSAGSLMEPPSDEPDPTMMPGNEGMTTSSAADATVDDAIGVLREMGLALPEDTTAENILERIVAAAIAVKGAKEQMKSEDATSPDNPVNTAQPKLQSPPGGLAMSQELTPQNQAVVNWATKEAAKSYKSRMEALVTEGKISPDFCNKVLAPRLKDLQLAFNVNGEPVAGTLDELLGGIEQFPPGTCLTGKTPSSQRDVRVTAIGESGDVFSIKTQVEPMPEHAGMEPAEGHGGEPTEERQQEIIKEQLKNSGRADLLPMNS